MKIQPFENIKHKCSQKPKYICVCVCGHKLLVKKNIRVVETYNTEIRIYKYKQRRKCSCILNRYNRMCAQENISI